MGSNIVIIPARMFSKRLPGKPLLVVGGSTILKNVYGVAKNSRADEVYVATGDKEICNYCQCNDMRYIFTSEDHPTGTHRCAEALEIIQRDRTIDNVINLQSDEPLILPESINILLSGVSNSLDCIWTISGPLSVKAAWDDNVAKVVVSHHNMCMWFSRAPMRGAHHHIGIYGFRSQFLKKLARLKPSFLSTEESLEQIRWLEEGFPIGSLFVEDVPLSINTKEDFEEYKRMVE